VKRGRKRDRNPGSLKGRGGHSQCAPGVNCEKVPKRRKRKLPSVLRIHPEGEKQDAAPENSVNKGEIGWERKKNRKMHNERNYLEAVNSAPEPNRPY